MSKFRLRTPSDGFTLRGVWDGKPLGLPSVEFRYRYASPEAIADYRHKCNNAGAGKDSHKARIELLTGRIMSWDIEDDKGQTLPVNADNLSHDFMIDPLLQHLTNAVMAYTPAMQESDVKN